MSEDVQDSYFRCLHIARVLFDSIDRSQRKRHQINNFLGFGFRKDDVVLEALKDQWTDRDRVPLPRVEYWVNKKFIPYLNHWGSPSDRLENRRIASLLQLDLEHVLKKIHEGNSNPNSAYDVASVLEIKVAIVLFAIDFLDSNGRQLISSNELKEEINAWYSRVKQLLMKEFGVEEVPPGEFYAPLGRLIGRIEVIVRS